MDLVAPIRQSFEGFLPLSARPDERPERGLEGMLRAMFPIDSEDGETSLRYCSYSIEPPKYDVAASLDRGMTFAAPLKMVVQMFRMAGAATESPGQIIDVREQEIYMGEVPLITGRGTVIVDGDERFFPLEMRRAPGLRVARGANGRPALFALDEVGNALVLEEAEGGAIRARFELDEAITPAVFFGERAARRSLRMTERGEFLLADAQEGAGDQGRRGRPDGRRRAPRLSEQPLVERELKRLVFATDAGTKGKRPLVKRGDNVTIKRLQGLAGQGVREVAVVSFEKKEVPAPLTTGREDEVAAWVAELVGSHRIPAIIDPRLEGVLEIGGASPVLEIGPTEVALLARSLLSGEMARRAQAEEPWPEVFWGPGEMLTQATFVGLRETVAEVRRLLAGAGSVVEAMMPHDVLCGRRLSVAFRVCVRERTKQLPARTPLVALESLRAVTHRGGLSIDERDVPLAEALVPLGAMFPDEARRGAAAMLESLPLETPEAPLVQTGLERSVAKSSGSILVARRGGEVTYVDEEAVFVTPDSPSMSRPDWYELAPADASFDDGRIGHRPTVSVGQRIEAGDVVAEGEATAGGGLALGRNARVVFDRAATGVTISARAAAEAWFTWLRARWLEGVPKDTRFGIEELTATPPNASMHAARLLDASGIVEEGAEVEPGDYLVGKRTPDGSGGFKDSSLRVPADWRGVVKRVRVFVRMGWDNVPRFEAQKERWRARCSTRREAEERAVTAAAKAIAERVLVEAGDALCDIAEKTLEDLLDRRTSEAASEALAALRDATYEARDALDMDHRERAYTLERGDHLPPGVVSITKVLLEERRPLKIGDVLADRNGLQVRVEAIADEGSMPLLADGSRADIVLPLSSAPPPSLLEAFLGARRMPAKPLPNDPAPPRAPETRTADIDPTTLPALLAEAERAAAGVLYLFRLA